MTERWLLARIAAPFAGMFSSPVTQGRNVERTYGPANRFFISQ